MYATFCIATLPFLLLFADGQVMRFRNNLETRDSATVVKDWERMENMTKTFVNDGVKMMLPVLMGQMQSINISSSCIQDSMQVIGGIRKLKTWAMRFLDSSSKLGDGLLSGSVMFFGAYDECIDTVALNLRSGKQKGKPMFTGKYCFLSIKPPLPPKKRRYKDGEIAEELKSLYKEDTILGVAMKNAPFMNSNGMQMGLCVPSGCSVDDISQIAGKVADFTRLYINVERCMVKEEPVYTPLMIFVISLYSFTGFVVFVATLTDMYFQKSGNKPHSTSIRVLLAFSFISNFRKLVDTSTASKSLSCFNGIRFLSMSWIIIGHGYTMPITSRVISGMLYAKRMAQEDIALQAIVNGSFSVDTFFFLGGFLVCYIATKLVKISHEKFNIKVYVSHRIWRLLPSLVFVILYTFIAKLITSGPITDDLLGPYENACKTNWWSTALFINNFYHPEKACLLYTWYSAVDMQLYLASLIITLPLLRWPKVGIAIAVVSLITCMAITAVDMYINDLPPVLNAVNFDARLIFNYIEKHYNKPYVHAGPYIIGILTGYLLAMKPNITIPKTALYVGWPLAVVFCTSVLYGPFAWNRGREATFWEKVFYSSCSRIAWILGVAWMVVCCATGHGGFVNYILSWKIWIPLGRLTYMAYLVHYVMMLTFVASIRSTFAPLHVLGVWIYLACIMVTYAIAFVGSMLVEAPMISLEKLLLRQRSQEAPSATGNSANHILGASEVLKGGRYLHNLDVTLVVSSESRKRTENEAFVYKL